MTPHTITITITDNPGCKSCNFDIHCNPPMDKANPNPTPAVKAVSVFLEAMNVMTRMKSIRIQTIRMDVE